MAPRKTRELQDAKFNSLIWNDFKFRDDDVIVASYPKCGTTWVQQIVGQLIFEGAENVPIWEISPWVDEALTPPGMMERLEAQVHRRVLKSHLPRDAMPLSPRAKYIYVARDGRDAAWSFYDMLASVKQLRMPGPQGGPVDGPIGILASGKIGGRLNDAGTHMIAPPFERNQCPPQLLPPDGAQFDVAGPQMAAPLEWDRDIQGFFRRWLKDGYPIWPFWEHVRTWWDARYAPNVLLVHFADLKANLDGEIRRIVDFLDFDIAEERWPSIIEHCSFRYMKAHAASLAPLGGVAFENGAEAFINKGVNGRWRDVLTAEEIAEYERRARKELGDECALWLAGGKAQR